MLTKVKGKVLLELDYEVVVGKSKEEFEKSEQEIIQDLMDSYINFGLFIDSAEVQTFSIDSKEEIDNPY